MLGPSFAAREHSRYAGDGEQHSHDRHRPPSAAASVYPSSSNSPQLQALTRSGHSESALGHPSLRALLGLEQGCAEKVGADDATAAGSSDDESSVNTDTLWGYASFRTSLQNAWGQRQLVLVAFSSERNESKSREMARNGAFGRVGASAIAARRAGLLSTFDFLFRTRSGRGGSSQGYRLVPEQGQGEEGPRGRDRDRYKGREDGVGTDSLSITPSSRGPGRISMAVAVTRRAPTAPTWTSPLDDDTDRVSQPSTSPFRPEESPLRRGPTTSSPERRGST